MQASEQSFALLRPSRLPRAVRAAFAACFVAGFLAHIFAFTNIIPNADGISRVSDAQQMTVSGRWFLHYASVWNGYVQSPAVIGCFSVLFLSVSAALTVSILKVRGAVFGALIGAVLVVFPSVAYTFLYLFTASAYCFGILLAVLSVWLVARSGKGIFLAVPLLACAIGTYQAYLAVAASLSLICVLLFALEGGHSVREILWNALRHLAFLIVGLLLYYLVLRIFLRVKELKLLDYKGIGSMGEGLTLKSLLALLVSAYRDFAGYFFAPGFCSYTTPILALANAVFALTGLSCLICLLRRGGSAKKPGVSVLTLFLCVLLPPALNLTVFMGEPMPIMRYSLVFAYVLVLTLADRAIQTGSGFARLLRGAAVGGAALMLLISFNVVNLAYTVSAHAHRATESFAARLVERVETTPGYVNGMEVIVIGGFPSQVYYSQIERFELVENYSNLSSSVLPLNKHIYYYLNDWLNVRWTEPEEATLIAVSNSESFQSMPLYPDDGSVVIQDGRVIVKLASSYTPKKDYEIAYEHRR